MKPFGDQRDWVVDHRYGMLLHWGIYSLLGYHEQHQMRARSKYEDYVKLAEQWNPVNFDPDAWLDLMEEAGMQYICLTSKHHDGFCLWDTKQTAYNTVNTPYGKDIIGMLAEACHRRNVPLVLYYSCVDWHQPYYPNQGRHHELPGPVPGGEPDHDRYMDFLREQIRELCTNYGKIDGIWWDMNVEQHVDRSINDMIRQLQPSAIVSDRGYDEGDFGTPERDFDNNVDPATASKAGKRVEANQSVGSESWGYRIDESYYTDRHLIRSIDRFLAYNANYMLNVGPQPDGAIPDEHAAILRRIGKWIKPCREAFDDTVVDFNFTTNTNVIVTRRGNTVYVHLNKDPESNTIKLKPLQTLPRSATLLNDGRPVKCVVDVPPSEWYDAVPGLRIIGLPVNEFSNSTLVVKLEFDESFSMDKEEPLAVDSTQDIHVR